MLNAWVINHPVLDRKVDYTARLAPFGVQSGCILIIRIVHIVELVRI